MAIESGNTPWRENAQRELEEMRNELEKSVSELEKEVAAEADKDPSFYPHPKVYWFVVLLYFGIQAGLATVMLLDIMPVVNLFGMPVSTAVVVLLFQALHLVFSFKTVSVFELAGIDLFGRPLYQPRSGLYVVPALILTLTKASRNYKDVRFPGPPDRIYRISTEQQRERVGGDVPEIGYVRPIFVTTGEPRLAEGERELIRKGEWNPLDQQLNIEIAYFIRYRPNQEYGGIFRIIRNLARGGNVDAAIEDLMREQTERDIKSVLTRQTTATILENWQLINDVFTLKTKEAILRLGVQLDVGGLDDINPSHETNEEQQKVARERFRRMQTITKADAERQRLTLEGSGAAEAERLRLFALARGYKRISESTGIGGEMVVASETAKEALSENADTIVIGADGVKDLLGLVKAGSGMFQRRNAPQDDGGAE